MKLLAPLICSGCGRRTRKMSAVLRKKSDNRIIGYLCKKKCTNKQTEAVKNRPAGMGWRQALITAIKHQGNIQELVRDV